MDMLEGKSVVLPSPPLGFGERIEAAMCGLERFRGRHDGESCYIFGDGPSLKWFDLACFSDFPAICCGLLPFHKDFQRLDVRYGLLIEPRAFVPRFLKSRSYRECASVTDAYKAVIRDSRDKHFFVHLSNYLSLKARNVSYVFRRLPRNPDGTKHPLDRFQPFAGSFHASLALARHLGFAKVYLVGFDGWTLHPARTLHWYELGEGQLFESRNYATDFLEAVRRDMEVVTISVNGESKNLEHVDYERFTGRPARFRENFELMERRHLEILATYPQYNIFQAD